MNLELNFKNEFKEFLSMYYMRHCYKAHVQYLSVTQ